MYRFICQHRLGFALTIMSAVLPCLLATSNVVLEPAEANNLRCEDVECSPALCHNAIILEGECCRSCPYYTPVFKVTPQDLGTVTEGQVNNIVFNMDTRLNVAANHIIGRNLWNVNVWASADPNGNGNRIGYKKQALSEEQAAVPTIKKYRTIRFSLSNITYVLDATDVTCSEIKYLCVEFGRGDNPQLEDPRLSFTVEGVMSVNDRSPASENLIGCETFSACNGTGTTIQHATDDEMMGSSSSSYDSGLLPCSFRKKSIKDGQWLTLDECTVCFCDNSTVVCNIQSCPIISCSDGQEPVIVDLECCESCPNDEIISKDDPVGCKYQGDPVPFGYYRVVDECTTCYCQANRILRCEIRSCPSILCDEPINLEGECCDVCPYNVPVWQVQPSNPPALTAGKINDILFNLTVEINGESGSPVGRGLWKVSSWISTNADGGGEPIGFTEQVLTYNQSAKKIVRPDFFGGFQWKINDIKYALDASNATCSEIKYLCVELARGDNPVLQDPRIQYTFTVEGVTSEYDVSPAPENLRGCSRVQSCEDEIKGSLLSSYDSGLLPCSYRKTRLKDGQSLTVDECTVCFCDNSTVVCNIQGCLIISCSDGQEPVIVNGECCESCPNAASTVDEIISKDDPVDCKYQGDPVPFGYYRVVDECTTCYCQANRILRCEIRSCPSIFCDFPINLEGECCDVCPYNLPVWQVQPSNPPALTAGKVNDIMFNLTVQVNAESGSPVGRGLWKLSSWISTSADGGGKHIGFKEQVLTDNQSAKQIVRPNFFGGFQWKINDIKYALDASNATCSEIKYLCVELARGDNPELQDPRIRYTFTVEGVTDEYDVSPAPENLRGCSRIQSCEETSAIRNKISFSVAKKSSQNAETEPVTINWNHVFNNAGGALNPDTGVFICSVPGSYFFTFLIANSPNAPPQVVKLMKNDEFMVTGLKQSSTDSAGSTGNTVILDLDVNDLVWLELYQGGVIFGSPERFSTFSGFLIFPS